MYDLWEYLDFMECWLVMLDSKGFDYKSHGWDSA